MQHFLWVQNARKLFCFTLCAGLFCIPCLGQSPQLAAGDSAYAQFNYKLALNHYQQFLQKDSTHFQALVSISRASYDLGLDYLAEGKSQTAQEEFEAAILYAQKLVEVYPDSASSHFLLAATMGNLALFRGGREKMILGRLVEKHSNLAISLDSLSAYPYVSLGVYYRELARLSWIEKTLAKMFYGRLPKTSVSMALEYLKKAEMLRPNFPFLHFELAQTYLLLKQPAEAAKHLQILIDLPPESSQDVRNQQTAKQWIKDLK